MSCDRALAREREEAERIRAALRKKREEKSRRVSTRTGTYMSCDRALAREREEAERIRAALRRRGKRSDELAQIGKRNGQYCDSSHERGKNI